MKIFIIAAGTTAALFGLYAGQAVADQSGMAGIHAQHVVKGRLCFSGHTHVGTGSSARNKREAIASAARDWSSFTAFEYGTSWGRWKIATAKTVNCERSSGQWSCEENARPCLNGRVRRARQAKR